MACIHEMRDMDTHYIIDPENNMAITNANSVKNSLQLGDHDSEIFTFEIPRYIDGHDMTLCDVVRVHFINTSTDKMDTSKDVYKVKDMHVDEEEPGFLVFTWKISGNATMYAGNLSFRILFACSDGNGGYSYKKWTSVFKDVYILDGFDNGEAVVADYSDILEQWEKELFGAGDSVIENIKATGAAQLEALQNEGEAQRSAIEAKGAETLATIPEDYTATYNMAVEGARTKADAIVQTAQGESILATDCSDDHVRNLRVFGKTTQETTNGYQLFDAERLKTFTAGGATITNNGDGSFTIAGADALTDLCGTAKIYTHEETVALLKKAGTIRFKNNELSNPYLYVAFWQGGNAVAEVTNRYNKETSAVITDAMFNDETFTMRIGFYGFAGDTITATTVKPMLYMDGDGTWEPFTGGKASPNPEYPQELASVENPEAVVCGKNIINAKALQTSTNTSLEVSEDGYTIKAIGGTASGWCSSLYELPEELVKALRGKKVFTKCDSFVSEQSVGARAGFNVTLADGTTVYPASVGVTNMAVTETINKNAVRIIFGVYANNSGNILEKDNTITIKGLRVSLFDYIDWEPHDEIQPLSILHTLHAIPVSSGGNYTDASGQQWICDEIDLESGTYVQRVIAKTFNGSDAETWRTYAVKDGAAYTAYQESVLCKDIKVFNGTSDETSPLLSNKFVAVPLGKIYSNGAQGVGISSATPTIRICVDACNGYTLDEFVSWLNENPFELIYPLAEPIETPLTAEEIEAFKALRTNYLTTTVLNDAGAWMEISYNADTKTFVVNNQTPATDEQIESAVNAYLKANPPSFDPLILPDQNTGKKYTLAVIDGKLTMSEVTS